MNVNKQIAKIAAGGTALLAIGGLTGILVLESLMAIVAWGFFVLAVMVVFLMYTVQTMAREPKKKVWVGPLPSDMFSKADRVKLNRDVGHWEYE